LEEIEYSDETFLDFVHDLYRPSVDAMVSFSMDNNTLYLHYQGNAQNIPIRNLRIPLMMTVQPEYMIQPTMN
jgi:hypothetical protein